MTSFKKMLLGATGIALIASGAYIFARPPQKTPPKTHFTLQLLHASDMESDLSALESAPYMSQLLAGFKGRMPENTVIVSAGDNYVPGPFYQASAHNSMKALLGRTGRGRADISMLNAMGFQVSSFGNHEFDEGPKFFASLLGKDAKRGKVYPGAAFPYLCANIDFRTEKTLTKFVTKDLQEASNIRGRIAKSAIITLPKTRIGFVGAITPALAQISKPGAASIFPKRPDNEDALVTLIQRAVDGLTQKGIDKIVLLSHMQDLQVERRLARKLKNVDIIVGGGSDSILADKTDRLIKGDKAIDSYPIWETSASGQPTAVLSTDGQYRYVGRLVIGFDEKGVLLKHTYQPEESGAYPTDSQCATDIGAPPPNKKVQALVDGIRRLFVKKDGNTFGRSNVYLNGMRLGVRHQETNLGNLTTDANLYVARLAEPTVHLSFKNGGAIRSAIGAVQGDTIDTSKPRHLPPPANPLTGKKEGQISQLDIENALKFNNRLILLTLTATQLKQIVEHGIAKWHPRYTPGSFPQISGFSFSFDPKRPAGQRVRSLRVDAFDKQPADTIVKNGALVGSPTRTFRVVTLQYLFKGGDNYPFPKYDKEKLNPVLLSNVLKDKPGKATFSAPGREQDALAEYLFAMYNKTPFDQQDTPPERDTRIQNLLKRKDTVIPK